MITLSNCLSTNTLSIRICMIIIRCECILNLEIKKNLLVSVQNSSVVSAETTVGAKLFQWGIVLREKRILQDITIGLGPVIL